MSLIKRTVVNKYFLRAAKVSKLHGIKRFSMVFYKFLSGRAPVGRAIRSYAGKPALPKSGIPLLSLTQKPRSDDPMNKRSD
jgi:hypothetical protein